jgi:predicted nucleotidyltransferase component of viral defense system
MNDAVSVLRELAASPDLFREHIQSTARRTGFRGELVEKDFYCSAILDHLAGPFRRAVAFKGGTCLSKVYAGFYRLSEDLDFSISIPTGASRGERSEKMNPVKEVCRTLAADLPGILELEPIHGVNASKQYIGTWGYRSVLSGETERIKVEVGLREPLLLPMEEGHVNTLLQNAFTGEALVAPLSLGVMAQQELWAEKVRAALSRREPAIRDLFDLDYACERRVLDLSDPSVLDMVRGKLSIPGNDPADVSEERLRALSGQVEGQLRPVLRDSEFASFNLSRVWRNLVALANRVEPA